MSHYVIAQITINDRDTYAGYEAGFLDIFMKYEGQIVSVDESPRVLEGNWDFTRTVVAKFPTADAAMDWYSSDEYQELAQIRFAASDANIALIAGL